MAENLALRPSRVPSAICPATAKLMATMAGPSVQLENACRIWPR